MRHLPPKAENFLTLADVNGRVSLKEDSPGVEVIRTKAKSFIKRNDIRSAKISARNTAVSYAVDEMVRELLTKKLTIIMNKLKNILLKT